MRLRVRMRSVPLGFLCVALIAVVAALPFSELLFRFVRKTTNESRIASSTFSDALMKTRHRLANHLWDAANDPVIQQNLDWGYQNSVSQALASRLLPGEFDGVEVVTADCQSVARAVLPNAHTALCQGAAPLPLRFSWDFDAARGGTALVLAVPLKTKKNPTAKYFAVGRVALSGPWSDIYPEFRRIADSLSLKISSDVSGKAPGRLLLRDGLAAENKAHAVLSTTHPILEILPRAAFALDDNPLRWPLLSMCLALFALISSVTMRRQGKERRTVLEFAKWCERLAATPPHQTAPIDEDQLQEISLPENSPLLTAREQLVLILRNKDAYLRSVVREASENRSALRERTDELVRTRARLSEVAELDSLTTQLTRSTDAFLKHMTTACDLAQNIEDIATEGVYREVTDCEKMISHWVEGIRERGSRKFIRSMAETDGETPGKTQLDESLEALKISYVVQGNALTALCSEAVRLRRALQHATEISALWHGLAQRTPRDEETNSLDEVFGSVLKLLETTASGPIPQFLSLARDVQVAVVKLPRPVWVAAVFHVCQILLESSKPEGPTIIATKLMKAGKHGMVIFSLGKQDDVTRTLNELAPSIRHNLEVARAMLAPYAVMVAILPSRGGSLPVAISWSLPSETNTKRIAPDPKSPELS
jgi:hypothetical protein